MVPMGLMYITVNRNKLDKLHPKKMRSNITKGIGIGDLGQHNASSKYDLIG